MVDGCFFSRRYLDVIIYIFFLFFFTSKIFTILFLEFSFLFSLSKHKGTFFLMPSLTFMAVNLNFKIDQESLLLLFLLFFNSYFKNAFFRRCQNHCLRAYKENVKMSLNNFLSKQANENKKKYSLILLFTYIYIFFLDKEIKQIYEKYILTHFL